RQRGREWRGRSWETDTRFRHLHAGPQPVHKGPDAHPAAKGPGKKSRATDYRGHRPFASEPAEVLPLRRPLLEAQAAEQSNAGEMLERRPDFAALRKRARGLSLSRAGRGSVSGSPLLVVEGLKKYY